MNQHLDTMRRIIELTDTGREALEYLLQCKNRDSEHLPLYLLPELVNAFLSVNESVAAFSEKLPSNGINDKSRIVADNLSNVSLALEAGDVPRIGVIVEQDLLPSYRAWQQELAECLNPLVLS